MNVESPGYTNLSSYPVKNEEDIVPSTPQSKHKELWERLQNPEVIGIKLSREEGEQLIKEYQELKKKVKDSV